MLKAEVNAGKTKIELDGSAVDIMADWSVLGISILRELMERGLQPKHVAMLVETAFETISNNMPGGKNEVKTWTKTLS